LGRNPVNGFCVDPAKLRRLLFDTGVFVCATHSNKRHCIVSTQQWPDFSVSRHWKRRGRSDLYVVTHLTPGMD
jgi:hypothetical protein